MEERQDGTMERTGSSDLEMVMDGANRQKVGLRFTNVAVPRGVRILSAAVQFTADESHSNSVALTITGEAADNAQPFRSVNGDVSARAATTASAAWNPPGWTVGEAGAAQCTPDIRQIIQEVVNRANWQKGNALILIVSGASGTRTAIAFDRNPAAAASLRVSYEGLLDSDGDETPDEWEAAQGLDPNNSNDAAQDADGDGMNNYEEYVAGTDVWDETDALELQVELGNEGFTVLFDGLLASGPGYAGKTRHYALETSPALSGGPWSPVPPYEDITEADGAFAVDLPLPPDGNGFYRIRVWLTP